MLAERSNTFAVVLTFRTHTDLAPLQLNEVFADSQAQAAAAIFIIGLLVVSKLRSHKWPGRVEVPALSPVESA